ncbi:hypothetical protein VitviT2T_028106 [Vitis vinifera]|uniref:Uncharacterized protein n=1 Tax=Vitis vinifera TaxID=29760 RepID=A0ABY9DS70_VITVI|nr:hypothetical protein VitviT2T_028106 [Vitis vinifera]
MISKLQNECEITSKLRNGYEIISKLQNGLQIVKLSCEMEEGLQKHFAKPREVAKMPTELYDHASEEESPTLEIISQWGVDFAEEGNSRSPFRSLKVISQLKGDFAAVSQLRNEGNCAAKWHSCAKKWFRSYETPFQMASRLRNSRSALHARLQTTITSSFHLQIAYRLKRWTPNFPRFETRYAISQLRNEVHCAAKWHSCAKSWFRNCETPCGMELWLRNWKFSLFGASQPFRSYQNGGSCAAKWHSCAKLDFVAAKISTENSNELRNGLAAKCLFP